MLPSYVEFTNKTSPAVSLSSWAFLFSEIIQYSQRRVSGIPDFEKKCVQPFDLQYTECSCSDKELIRLSIIGYRLGVRIVELLPLRDSLPPSTSRSATGPPRFIRLLPLLHYVHTPVYRYLFSRPADALEKSTENEDEYMIADNDPVLTRGVEVPREMSSLSCMALVAGVVEAIMDGWGFVRVTLTTCDAF